jgi:hypothetical protein
MHTISFSCTSKRDKKYFTTSQQKLEQGQYTSESGTKRERQAEGRTIQLISEAQKLSSWYVAKSGGSICSMMKHAMRMFGIKGMKE